MKLIARKGKVLELNTSELRKPHDETYPGSSLLSIAQDYYIPICLGSDAHKPKQVAAHFDKAVRLLEQAGYDKTPVWNDSLSVFQPLS